ncbi:MAG TPA: hypothetical protein VGS19_05940 [Streptosporangiaceae bacterium]|nr:hypothetical protein [Streptosporangiaceae bacterium]
MSYEEKGTRVYLVTSAGGYVAYVAVVLSLASHTPIAHVSYVPVLLWTCVASIIASMVGRTLVETARPSDSRRGDVRDREIARFGEHASRWFVIGGAAAGLVMAMARLDYFWIANVIYLGFVLWAVAGSVLRILVYRRGL